MAALVTASPLSLPLGTLRNAARAAGFKIDDVALEAHLEYLVGSGFLIELRDKISAGVKRWKSTAAGTDYCEAEGLV